VTRSSPRFDVLTDVRTKVGEGPVWNSVTGELWWVDVHPGLLHRLNVSTGEVQSRDVAPRFAFVVPTEEGMVGGFQGGLWHQDADGDEAPRVLSFGGDQPETRPNDGACDPFGRLWFGTVDRKGERGRCHLYSVDASGTVTPQLAEVSISNGLGWSPSGTTFYYIDSVHSRIDAFDFDPESGTLGERRILAATPEGLPDGLTVDADGNVWVAMYGAGTVLQFSPQGSLLQEVEVPTLYPTSCAFGGPDLDALYVTTSNAAILRRGEAVSVYDGALLVADVGFQGLNPPRCKIPGSAFEPLG
jgi:D-xylonolactonase